MAFSLGGFLGGLVQTVLPSILGIPSPTQQPVATSPGTQMITTTPGIIAPVIVGVPNTQGAVGMAGGNGGNFLSKAPLNPTSISVLRLIAAGAGDSQVRTVARQAGVSKTDLFNALTAVEIMGDTGLSRLERIAISDQIERIFRPRPRPVISRGLKRTMKQMEFMMKFAKKFAGSRGHAHFTTRTTGHK